MKINMKDLRRLIRENVKTVLQEKKEESKELYDSLDSQVDDYLVTYEKEAKSVKKEGIDLRFITRNFLESTISEAEEDKSSKENKKLSLEDIDLEIFANSVVRLIDNYDSLLEVKKTLAKRAINFLLENYEQNVVEEFKVILEDRHDISLNPVEVDSFVKFPAPPADRAGGSEGAGA